MANTPEMVDSVNMVNLAEIRVTIEDISEQMGVSVVTKHKTVQGNFEKKKKKK